MAKRNRSTSFDNDKEMFQILKNNSKSEDNSSLIKLTKRAIRKIIQDELTERQKEYIMLYYYNDMDMCEIAKMYGVNKSTISRTINRARMNILEYTKYYLN